MYRCALVFVASCLQRISTQNTQPPQSRVSSTGQPQGWSFNPLPAPLSGHQGTNAPSWVQPVPVVTPGPIGGTGNNQGEPAQVATNVPAWSGQMVQPNRPDSGMVPQACEQPPLIPQTFFAERNFWGFRSYVSLRDRKNNEWGYVVSNWWQWSWNPFGNPGARLFLKRKGSNALGLQPGAKGQSWMNQFLNVWGANEVLLGESEVNFWQDQATIKDCRGNTVITTNNNVIFDAHNAKAGYYITTSDIERNQAMMYDLSMPPQALVRMTQSEPCSPFPPFCSRLDAWRLFPAGKWQGEIIQKGYGQTLGTVISITMAANGASDIRYLSLYGAHLFAPTRFAPCINWLLFFFFLSSCSGCCCFGCWRTCYRTEAEQREMVERFEFQHTQSGMNMKTGKSVYDGPMTSMFMNSAE